MALQAVAVTLGAPDVAGEITIVASNLAPSIAQAVTDTTTLQTNIGTMQTDATTADTNVATVQTDIATATTDVNAAVTKAGNVGADTDALGSSGATYNLVTLFPGISYNSGTKQLSGTPSASATLTVAQQQGVMALFNALGADVVLNTTKVTQVQTDIAQATTDAATAKAATLASKNFANSLNTTAIAADHTAAQAIIANANVFLQFDDGVVTNVAALNGGLVAALTFVRHNSILPT